MLSSRQKTACFIAFSSPFFLIEKDFDILFPSKSFTLALMLSPLACMHKPEGSPTELGTPLLRLFLLFKALSTTRKFIMELFKPFPSIWSITSTDFKRFPVTSSQTTRCALYCLFLYLMDQYLFEPYGLIFPATLPALAVDVLAVIFHLK
ncbi:hypothetical protein BBC53_04165 [Salmonella enterica subsp. enterica serovar Thompson]|nr:Hypothetical protein FORC80_2468 [Salmonella enterica subsp. enterica serovar Virchow]OCI76339.1 hypothetical protein BBC53_04165 [Salmonella enterica subsp. enterica serovar Thompson]